MHVNRGNVNRLGLVWFSRLQIGLIDRQLERELRVSGCSWYARAAVFCVS